MSTTSSWSRFEYDPLKDQSLLVPLIQAVMHYRPQTDKEWRKVLKIYPKPNGGFFSKTEMISGFRALKDDVDFGIQERELLIALKMKPTRTQSGVSPITVLTKPYPCPGQCIFCPNDVKMPKSYLSDEPGAQRAALNRFDPFAQTWNRLLALYRMGHSVDKVELIILGGTWSSYPKSYQKYFVLRCFEAVNQFGTQKDPQPYMVEHDQRPDFKEVSSLIQITPAEDETQNAYNHTVSRHLRSSHQGKLLAQHEDASWEELEHAHTLNESTPCRVVGLVIETRPDEINQKEVLHLRRLGATKIQIGIQSLSDDVLSMNRRGHTVDMARKATQLLRQAGFKIHAHWMANLYGSSAQKDIEDYQKLFTDPSICPDELKLYPCSLIEHTELMTHYQAGRWRPYEREELLEVLCEIMPFTPKYCRLSRVIRDIPSTSIHAGNQETNFREVVQDSLKKKGVKLKEIRAREVKLDQVHEHDVTLCLEKYQTAVSQEYFISFETENALLGFCRLSLPLEGISAICEELEGCAMIREVHVYGQSLGIGKSNRGQAQHRGLGTRLVEKACELAQHAQFKQVAVISAIGTRHYYRRLGFKDHFLYQHRTL